MQVCKDGCEAITTLLHDTLPNAHSHNLRISSFTSLSMPHFSRPRMSPQMPHRVVLVRPRY